MYFTLLGPLRSSSDLEMQKDIQNLSHRLSKYLKEKSIQIVTSAPWPLPLPTAQYLTLAPRPDSWQSSPAVAAFHTRLRFFTLLMKMF